jgi:hypothetical protein
MTDPKYQAFTALDPFFDIVQQGLAGQVAMATIISIQLPRTRSSSFDIFSRDGHRG